MNDENDQSQIELLQDVIQMIDDFFNDMVNDAEHVSGLKERARVLRGIFQSEELRAYAFKRFSTDMHDRMGAVGLKFAEGLEELVEVLNMLRAAKQKEGGG